VKARAKYRQINNKKLLQFKSFTSTSVLMTNVTRSLKEKESWQYATSELLFTSVSKRVQPHNLSYGNEFDLQDSECAKKTRFKMRGCAPRLVLKQRYEQLGNRLFKGSRPLRNISTS